MLKIRSFKGIILIASFILFAFLYGCGGQTSQIGGQTSQTGGQTPQTGEQPTDEHTSGAIAQTPESTKIQTQEERLTEKLLKEEGVNTAKIYIQDNIVYCAINIKTDSNTENARKLAQRYADELKELYKDKKVNVQAVQKDKNIANIQK